MARLNVLDKAIAYFSPGKALARERARQGLRIFEGATHGRRGSSWRSLATSSNAELQMAIRPLRDRCRDLARNTPHVPRALDIFASHVVGNGVTPVPRTGSDRLDRQVLVLWDDWIENADVTGQLSYYAMQALAVRSMIESGEVVGRFIDRPIGKMNVPFQIQLLEADYIDQWRDGIYGDPNGKSLGLVRSRLGVGLGDFDRRVGLWLWKYHPGEITTINLKPLLSDFVSGAELMHMFRVLRPGQVRGMPWFAPVLTTARELADFLDACNVKARVEACFTGFITNDDSTAPLLDPAVDPWTNYQDQSNPNAQMTTLEPGLLKELRSGQDIKFAQPTSNTQIDPILKYDLQAMACGVGLTYHMLSGDLSQANYSSLRAGSIDFLKLISQLQNHVLIPQWCKPTWDRFIDRAILAGQLRERVGGYPCEWVVPVREYVNPETDLAADISEVRAGRITPQQFIAAKGNDFRKVVADWKEFTDLENEGNLTFSIDAGKVDSRGRAVVAAPADSEARNTAEDAAADEAESASSEDADE